MRRVTSRLLLAALEPLRLGLRRSRGRKQLLQLRMSAGLADASLVLVTVVRDDADRLPFWLGYYRRLGIREFLVIDNASRDDTVALLESESGVTLFSAATSYRGSRFGTDWVNAALHSRCRGKWILWVDSDEFLTYDGAEDHGVPDLVQRLEAMRARSLQCMLIDLYSSRTVDRNTVARDEDPFEVCDYYDPAGYRMHRNRVTRTTWIQGGVRDRVFFGGSGGPMLNKTPLVRWSGRARFAAVAHRLGPFPLNDDSLRRGMSGALLHQRFLSSVGEKAADPDHVAEHNHEYRRYSGFSSTGRLVTEQSHRYSSPRDLLADGLITPIRWTEDAEGRDQESPQDREVAE